MEAELKNYIKNMFAMDSAPVWDSSYEGVIFYDKTAKKWVVGNNAGWQVLDRKSTTISGVTPTKWIDPFEYPNNSIIRNNYFSNSSDLVAYSEDTINTYGNYSLKVIASVSGSLNSTLRKYLVPPKNFTNSDAVKFDIRSSREGESLMFSASAPVVENLGTWANRLELTIPSSKIDEDLTHFPVGILLNDVNGFSDVIDELAIGIVGDDFIGTDGDSPNPDRWEITASEGTSATIINNKLRLFIPSADNFVNTISNGWKIAGDFDIQIDFEILDGPSENYWQASFNVELANGHYFSVQRLYNGTQQYRYGSDAGAWNQLGVSGLKDDSSGKLRITRNTDTFTAYYWGGSDWASLGSDTSYFQSIEPVYVKLKLDNWSTYPSAAVYFDNFTVVSGTTVWDDEPNKKKIAVTKDDGITQLYCEIENFELHNRTATLWVSKHDWTISSIEDTKFYLYYDKNQNDNVVFVGDIASDAGKSVWNSNYVLVNHMSQDPSGSSVKDSTSNSNHGAPFSGMKTSDLVDATVGKGIVFDNSSDGLLCTANQSINLTTTVTLESAINITSYGPQDGTGYGNIINKDVISLYTHDYSHTGYNDHSLIIRFGDSTAYTSIDSIPLDTDLFISTTYCSVSGLGVKINNTDINYGIYSGDFSGIISDNSTTSLYIGNRSDYARHIDGTISSVFISDTVRSDAWLKATTYTLSNDLVEAATENYNDLISKNININKADTFQTETVDISTVSGTCTSLSFKVLNDDLANTFYIDNMYLV